MQRKGREDHGGDRDHVHGGFHPLLASIRSRRSSTGALGRKAEGERKERDRGHGEGDDGRAGVRTGLALGRWAGLACSAHEMGKGGASGGVRCCRCWLGERTGLESMRQARVRGGREGVNGPGRPADGLN